jgi:DNA-3-methyladenine glycosylase II
MTALRSPETTTSFTAASLTPEGYEKARRLLMRRDPILAMAIKRIGPCGMAGRQRHDHLSALVGAIVSQQLSTKAAATIFARFLALFPEGEPLAASAINAQSDAALRGVGLSGQKVSYLRDLGARIDDGRLDLGELETLPDEEVIDRLVAVKGFGRWTAEMFLMFRAASAGCPASRRSGNRQRDSAALQAAEAAGREARAENRRGLEAVSIGRVLVPVADAPRRTRTRT